MHFRSAPHLHGDRDFSDVDAPGLLPEGQQTRSARASREDFWDLSEKNLLIAKLAEAKKTVMPSSIVRTSGRDGWAIGEGPRSPTGRTGPGCPSNRRAGLSLAKGAGTLTGLSDLERNARSSPRRSEDRFRRPGGDRHPARSRLSMTCPRRGQAGTPGSPARPSPTHRG